MGQVLITWFKLTVYSVFSNFTASLLSKFLVVCENDFCVFPELVTEIENIIPEFSQR